MKKSRSSGKPVKIVLSSPVTLTFAFICIAALILNVATGGTTNRLIFSVYRSSLLNPLTYLRFFTHVFGHGSVGHLANNMMLLLVLGPLLEDRYGGNDMILVILITAFVTGLAHFILFPSTALLGASGVVFAFILLGSAVGIREKEIPLTLILVALLYIGQQVYEGLFASDNISQLTHIIGGIVGAVFGYVRRK